MPKFKEVVPLRTMAMDCFIESVIQCCNRLSKADNRDLFRSGVIAIRTEVQRYLPGPLLAELGSRFFENFHLQSSDKLDYQVGLEMIMDIKIIGLRLKGKNLDYLDLREGHRFPGLEELDFSDCWYLNPENRNRYLHTYNLNYLTKFVIRYWCNDEGLAIIGQQCQNLEVLKITGSGHVTDEGLRALGPCSNLRYVHFRRCFKVSYLGLNHLLSAHEKLENFYYEPHDYFEVPNFDTNIDVSSGLDLSVTVPSLQSLIIRISRQASPGLDLEVIVRKFPNLNNLEINCPAAVNLSALKRMNNLAGLKIHFFHGIANENFQQTWEQIEEILTSIGPHITTLTLWASERTFSCRQEQLDMIYNRCPNLEHLAFDHVYRDGILTVPEFNKLRVLTPRTSPKESVYNLKFGTMLNLEILSLPYSGELINQQTIIEMMRDEKFPKLSVLRIVDWNLSATQSSLISGCGEIERIVKENNLDFRVVNLGDRTFVCDYFTNDRDDDFHDDYTDAFAQNPSPYPIPLRFRRRRSNSNWCRTYESRSC